MVVPSSRRKGSQHGMRLILLQQRQRAAQWQRPIGSKQRSEWEHPRARIRPLQPASRETSACFYFIFSLSSTSDSTGSPSPIILALTVMPSIASSCPHTRFHVLGQHSAALLPAYCAVLSLTINLLYNFLRITFLSQRICRLIHLIPAEQSLDLNRPNKPIYCNSVKFVSK